MNKQDASFSKTFGIIVLIIMPILGVVFLLRGNAVTLLVAGIGALVWLWFLSNVLTRDATTDREEANSAYLTEYESKYHALLETTNRWAREEISYRELKQCEREFEEWNAAMRTWVDSHDDMINKFR